MPTTVKTGWLHDKNGDKFAPKTLTSQVQTSNGILLEDKIQADLDAALESKSDSTHKHDSDYDAKGSADIALASAKSYTDTKTSTLAHASHTHDDRYYLKAEVDNLLVCLTIPEIDAICVIPTPVLAAGLYRNGAMAMSWDELVGTYNMSDRIIEDGIFSIMYETLDTMHSTSGNFNDNLVNTLVGELIIDTGITAIGSNAFKNCTGLTKVTLPDGFTFLMAGVFLNCTNLTSIIIPNTLTYIGNEDFAYCEKLTNITYKGTIEEWNTIEIEADAFTGVPATQVICSDGTVSLS